MSLPTVFVITVCRNAASLIEDTIKSVISQTYPNVSYLIIDGASTDGTVNIIKRYEDRLAYWCSEPDKGIYDAMNKGLAKARELADSGDCWVNFMNAGDSFADPKVLQDIFSSTIIQDKLVVGGHANLVYSNKVEVLYAQKPEVITHQLPYCHQSTFVRLSLNNELWNFSEKYKIAADYKVFYDIFYKFGSDCFYTIDKIVANYSMDGSMTFNNLKRAKGEYLSIQAKHRDWTWWKEYIKWRCL